MPETTFIGVALKQLLVGASAFAAGILIYRALVLERKRRRPFLSIGYASIVVIIALVAELIVKAPLINPEWRSILYLLALVGTFVGFTGDAIRQHKRGQKKT